MPRKLGYRFPKSRKLYPILEQLFLAGYGTREAWRIMREQGHKISRQTVWKRWQEFKGVYPEALLRYGLRRKENA